MPWDWCICNPNGRAVVGALDADRCDRGELPVIHKTAGPAAENALPDPIHHEALPLAFVAVAPAGLIVAVLKPIRVVAQKKIGSGLSEALAIVDFV